MMTVFIMNHFYSSLDMFTLTINFEQFSPSDFRFNKYLDNCDLSLKLI